jgi:hypothetical protein
MYGSGIFWHLFDESALYLCILKWCRAFLSMHFLVKRPTSMWKVTSEWCDVSEGLMNKSVLTWCLVNTDKIWRRQDGTGSCLLSVRLPYRCYFLVWGYVNKGQPNPLRHNVRLNNVSRFGFYSTRHTALHCNKYRLKVFRGAIALYCEDNPKHINTLFNEGISWPCFSYSRHKFAVCSGEWWALYM